MNGIINDACKRRGCFITLLPSDSGVRDVRSKLYGTKYDTKKVLPLVNLSLDKKLETKGQMEKMAA